MPSHVVVIQGGSASGKTTLTRRLQNDLQLGALMKDDIKECLFDNFMLPADRNDSRVYGIATIEAQLAAASVFAASGKNFILEGAFHSDIANDELKQFAAQHHVRLSQIYCTASSEIRMKRYNDRVVSGQRHKGHHDVAVYDVELFAAALAPYGVLEIEPTITYDTTQQSETRYNEIIKFIKHFLETPNATSN